MSFYKVFFKPFFVGTKDVGEIPKFKGAKTLVKKGAIKDKHKYLYLIKHIRPLIHNHVPTNNCDGMIGSVLA